MFSILKKIRRNFLIRKLKKTGIIINHPICISNYEHLNCVPPVYIGPDAWMELRGNLFIESGTIIGPRIKVHTSNHNYQGNLLPYDEKQKVKSIIIHENVWIGADVTLLSGIEIGEGAIIGAGSVVTKSVPKLAVIGGNPARIIKFRDSNQYYDLKNKNRIYLSYKLAGKTNQYDNERIVTDQ